MFSQGGPSLYELAEQALSSTSTGYDKLAPKFDLTPFRTPQDLIDMLGQRLGGPGSFERGLDVCCGTGGGVRMLRDICTEEAVGIDFSEGMLGVAQQELGKIEGTPFRLVHGDAFAMDFDNEFDIAVCFGALGHVLPRDEDAFLGGIYRALKPGGRFVILTHEHPGPTHPAWWVARGFNFAMHVRNAVLDPPFIMFYLTFTLPTAVQKFERHGFRASVMDARFDGKYHRLRALVGVKPE